MSDQPPTPQSGAGNGKPGYPITAVEWLTGASAIVLDFAAGQGLLTSTLVDLDHEVYAVDASDSQLAKLRDDLPDVPTALATINDIPLPGDSIDVIVWQDASNLAGAATEFVRVLAPGGRVAVAYNRPDQRIPWVRRLATILEIDAEAPDPTDDFDDTDLFEDVETATFSHWHELTRESLDAFVMSHVQLRSKGEVALAHVWAEVQAVYAEYERGIDGLRLPYITHCFRAAALIPEPPSEDEVEDEPPLIDFN